MFFPLVPNKCKFCGKNAACEVASDVTRMESYECSCKMGYFRDGNICSISRHQNLFFKFEEFLEPDHCKSCRKNAACALNDEGEHVCSCNEGYFAAGKICGIIYSKGVQILI